MREIVSYAASRARRPQFDREDGGHPRAGSAAARHRQASLRRCNASRIHGPGARIWPMCAPASLTWLWTAARALPATRGCSSWSTRAYRSAPLRRQCRPVRRSLTCPSDARNAGALGFKLWIRTAGSYRIPVANGCASVRAPLYVCFTVMIDRWLTSVMHAYAPSRVCSAIIRTNTDSSAL